MPVIALIGVLAVVLILAIALVPLSLIQRYRVGTARRPARGWFITLNLVALVISTGMFIVGAALTSAWVPNALSYTLIGILLGCLLGIAGLGLTRWEPSGRTLYYTPNAVLVFVVTIIVTARVAYGFWRSWQVWNSGLDTWSAAFGVASAMGAGAVVLGYYLTYWLGVRRRFARHEHRAGRPSWATQRSDERNANRRR